jgi:hypothetical protein
LKFLSDGIDQIVLTTDKCFSHLELIVLSMTTVFIIGCKEHNPNSKKTNLLYTLSLSFVKKDTPEKAYYFLPKISRNGLLVGSKGCGIFF